MEEYIYNDNNQIEIIKLKNNLMCSTYYSDSYIPPKDIYDIVRQIINEKKGKILEKNIRESLKINLSWTDGEIPRKFAYREILIKDTNYIVIPTKPIVIKFDNDSYQFSIIDNDTLEVKNINRNEKIINIPKDQQQTLNYNKTIKIIVSCSKDIEIDGVFTINNFNFDKLDENEVVLLHKGLKKDDNISSYEYAIIEVKLSDNKIKELIKQLKRDKYVCETVLKKKILLIGFINSKRIEADFSDEVSDLNCLLFGLKNSELFGKDVTQYIDWNLVKDFVNLNQKYDDLNQKYDALNQKYDALNQTLNQKYDALNQTLNQKYDELNKKYDDLNNAIINLSKKIDCFMSFVNPRQNENIIKAGLLGNKRIFPDN